MDRIKILDCTLRDGGYCNQWKFGLDNAKEIVTRLVESNVEIIECGFLTNKVIYDNQVTKFTTIDEIKNVIPDRRDSKMFVAMINYGEYDVDDIPEYNGESINGLRIAFHKKDLVSAIQFSNKVKEKGYKVFIQAMVSLNYSDEEFLELINLSNAINPYAFYIVDSFGVMKEKDLTRLFYMVEHNLNKDIIIGYHSHNNMQLAYSNAQSLVSVQSNRELIIDSSIYGMGRGAGNLNTELFVEYLNDNLGKEYRLKPLLTIIDKILSKFYMENYWGYSLSNYLSAKHNAHPDYASYLDGKKTLTVENIDEIFAMMDPNKKGNFDKTYIKELFQRYMERDKIYDEHLFEFKESLKDKEVLIIAPGKSSEDEKDVIIEYATKKNITTIAVNFEYDYYDTDYIFISNARRFVEIKSGKRERMIVTSNISGDQMYLQVKYSDLINSNENVSDNSGLMLINFLRKINVKRIWIAGMDGYFYDVNKNFADSKMNFIAKSAVFDAMNEGIESVLREYAKDISIEFITHSRFCK